MKKLILSFLGLSVFFTSCVKDQYDPPANPTDPSLTANYTIYDLKNDYKSSGQLIMTIAEDKIMEVIVSADDKGGNFYKEIVVQDKDNRAAIGMLINRSNLYNDLPVGRKLFVKLKGMAITKQNNLIVLGGYIDTVTVPGAQSLGYIPSAAIGTTIIKGSLNNEVKIEEVAINALSETHHYKLIKFKDVEFACNNLSLTYADAVNLVDANRTLMDKNGNDIIVRTSGYSTFAGTKLAQGKGELTAIFTVYRNDLQLKLRDLNDVKLTDTNRTTPCGSTGGGGGGTATLTTIKDLRATYSGNGVKVTSKYIEGTVISDKDGKNINSQNLAIQDATGGIIIRFSAAHTYAMGTKLKITFNGDSLTKYAGVMQVFVPSSAVSTIGTGSITPATVTIADINNNIDNLESTLVKIVNATFSATGTYNGSKTLSDGSASITHYTASTATFSGSTLPTGAKTITAIVGRFNSTKQISIRNTSDVQ